MKFTRPLSALGWSLAIIGFLAFHLGPFLWQALTSVKEASEVFATPITYWPTTWSWSAYRDVFTVRPFARYMWNSTVVALAATTCTITLAGCAAYAITHLKVRGGSLWLYASLFISVVPPIVFLVPMYQVVHRLHLLNNRLVLVFLYTVFHLPLALWLLSNAFRAIPTELDEAAQVDGFSPWQRLWKIFMPLAAPAVVTTGLLVFIGCWNEFLFALTFMADDHLRTVPVGVAMLSGVTSFEIPWSLISASVVVTTLPVLVVVLIFQRRLVEGLTAGAMK